MNINRIVGDNIRGFRAKKGWSQEKLAVRSGLYFTYIGKVERAESTISVANLFKIAKQFQLPSHILLIENAYQFSDEQIKKLTP